MTDQSTDFLASTWMLADDALLKQGADWQKAGHGLVVAFVVRTWGSSPRQVGSIMLVRDDVEVAGSVSGGCVEGAVIAAALELIKAGGSRLLDFGVADGTAWDIGLSCGGQISILIMAVSDDGFPPQLLSDAGKSLELRQPVSLQIPVKGGAARKSDRSLAASVLEGDEFWFSQLPRPQLIIIGAVHISQHLSSMAAQSGFDVTVIDPRSTFATAARFPGIKLVFEWPDIALADISLDNETALIALTHDSKIDDVALKMVLNKPLFHIACLGSRRTQAARLDRLAEAGFSSQETEKIKGPAGLDIGAKTPAEIAVSVLAELVSAYRGKILK